MIKKAYTRVLTKKCTMGLLEIPGDFMLRKARRERIPRSALADLT